MSTKKKKRSQRAESWWLFRHHVLQYMERLWRAGWYITSWDVERPAARKYEDRAMCPIMVPGPEVTITIRLSEFRMGPVRWDQ